MYFSAKRWFFLNINQDSCTVTNEKRQNELFPTNVLSKNATVSSWETRRISKMTQGHCWLWFCQITANRAGNSVLFKDTSRPIFGRDRSVDYYTNRLLERWDAGGRVMCNNRECTNVLQWYSMSKAITVQGHSAAGRIKSIKNPIPMKISGIEPATFRLAAQCHTA